MPDCVPVVRGPIRSPRFFEQARVLVQFDGVPAEEEQTDLSVCRFGDQHAGEPGVTGSLGNPGVGSGRFVFIVKEPTEEEEDLPVNIDFNRIEKACFQRFITHNSMLTHSNMWGEDRTDCS